MEGLVYTLARKGQPDKCGRDDKLTRDQVAFPRSQVPAIRPMTELWNSILELDKLTRARMEVLSQLGWRMAGMHPPASQMAGMVMQCVKVGHTWLFN